MREPINSPTTQYALRGWWFAILHGLAGGHPGACWGGGLDEAYHEREAMKLAAGNGLFYNAEPQHPAFRAPWWVLMAYAHWCRAREDLDSMDIDDFNQAFERGMNFRRYLGAWLWSVGVPKLSMTAVDLEAVHDLTGVAPLPHPLLPRGRSEFLMDCFQTTKVDSVPARDMDAETVLKAFAASEVSTTA